MVKSKQPKCDDKNIISGRRKRSIKVVFDPSDNNLPKRKRNSIEKFPKPTLSNFFGSSLKSENDIELDVDNGLTAGVCSVCRKQKNDKFISCCDCCNKAHVSCLDVNVGLLRMRPDNTWQCPHCKTCVFCEETGDAGVLTVCKVCSDAYHLLCHTPRIKSFLLGSSNWICSNCKDTSTDTDYTAYGTVIKHPNNADNVQKNKSFKNIKCKKIEQKNSNECNNLPKESNEINSFTKTEIESEELPIALISTNSIDSIDEASTSSNKISQCSLKELVYSEDFGYEIDPRVPDVSNWSCDEVCNYFMNIFPDDASIFKDEEIDGLSLLLIDRETVLKNFNIKLGNALKIWKHIVILQERRENVNRLFL